MKVRGLPKTYQPVAIGKCPFCHAEKTDLRFGYDPYQPDDLFLICVQCGEDMDEAYREYG